MSCDLFTITRFRFPSTIIRFTARSPPTDSARFLLVSARVNKHTNVRLTVAWYIVRGQCRFHLSPTSVSVGCIFIAWSNVAELGVRSVLTKNSAEHVANDYTYDLCVCVCVCVCVLFLSLGGLWETFFFGEGIWISAKEEQSVKWCEQSNLFVEKILKLCLLQSNEIFTYICIYSE